MSIVYRDATPKDWPAIERLLCACGLPLAGAKAHAASFLLAVEGEAVVGCVGAEIYDRAALLRSLAVAQSHRGHGIGDALEARVIEALRARGVKRVGLLTMTAERFFTRRGFKRVEREDLPAALQASEEMKGATCAGSVAMLMSL
jgi:amino-acid N-acetyltransferase